MGIKRRRAGRAWFLTNGLVPGATDTRRSTPAWLFADGLRSVHGQFPVEGIQCAGTEPCPAGAATAQRRRRRDVRRRTAAGASGAGASGGEGIVDGLARPVAVGGRHGARAADKGRAVEVEDAMAEAVLSGRLERAARDSRPWTCGSQPRGLDLGLEGVQLLVVCLDEMVALAQVEAQAFDALEDRCRQLQTQAPLPLHGGPEISVLYAQSLKAALQIFQSDFHVCPDLPNCALQNLALSCALLHKSRCLFRRARRGRCAPPALCRLALRHLRHQMRRLLQLGENALLSQDLLLQARVPLREKFQFLGATPASCGPRLDPWQLQPRRRSRRPLERRRILPRNRCDSAASGQKRRGAPGTDGRGRPMRGLVFIVLMRGLVVDVARLPVRVHPELVTPLALPREADVVGRYLGDLRTERREAFPERSVLGNELLSSLPDLAHLQLIPPTPTPRLLEHRADRVYVDAMAFEQAEFWGICQQA
mmetsp:Transcript_42076/g.116224  ORF Transcript_42076/g.116224 Transcript_42076/m.116224 type:complete len:479 (+) Transcript_42076:432-1868(+)